jgi:hypothetical protein
VFYAACCRMVFGLSSPNFFGAIICHRVQFSIIWKPGQEDYTIEPAKRLRLLVFLRLGLGSFGDVTGAVKRALHPIVF